MPARRFIVSGRVQGVGFRHFTMRAAVRIGLRGWARNRPDGTVEVFADGEPAALDALYAHLAAGPPAARVDEVEVSEVEQVPALTGFGLRFQ